MEKEIQIRGRIIGSDDLERIRQLIAHEGDKGRTHLSRRLCRIWDWRQANGAYREIACRELLRKLEARGLIVLPSPLRAARKPGYRNTTTLPGDLDTTPIEGQLCRAWSQELRIDRVSGTSAEPLYNGLIDAYHYLGYGQGTGEQLKYLIWWQSRPLAAIGFAAAAWRVACRDRFIGWDEVARKKHLHRIVNNHRFLILPWVRLTNLASWILSQVCRRLRPDWQARYAHEIVLVETFVEKDRFEGTCYRAANWICLGQTTGRGRNDRFSRNWLPIKQVYVYPLVEHFRQRCQAR